MTFTFTSLIHEDWIGNYLYSGSHVTSVPQLPVYFSRAANYELYYLCLCLFFQELDMESFVAWYQGGKRNPNPNFSVRILSGGVAVFHVNGWGPKSSIRPSKPGKSNFLGGISRDFAGMSRKCPKSLRKKCLCSILVPYGITGRTFIFGEIISAKADRNLFQELICAKQD